MATDSRPAHLRAQVERRLPRHAQSALRSLWLRKDDFDRVANETLYLEAMNGARADKARLLKYVRPGRIVEVDPAGAWCWIS